MAMSSDATLQELVPDILDFGIEGFFSEHTKAQADIEREIRIEWWPRRGLSGDLIPSKLTESQWSKAASYLVLWRYALPQLTTWVDGDRFQAMIDFYKTRYHEEMAAIFADGVEYDADGDGAVSDEEKKNFSSGHLVR